MSTERIDRAIARIEGAAERIEIASRSSSTNDAHITLAKRHERLRREVEASVAELDQLLLGLER